MLVYKISNTVNDRVYVGLTTCSLEKRWREHKCAANTGSDKPLYRAMRKYGIENFSIELLHKATSIEEMRAAELKYIQQFKSHALEEGYNLTDHGYNFGHVNRLTGDKIYNAKLTEDIVAFIRDPKHWDKTNAQMLLIVKEHFGFAGARDTIRDARRGDAWSHLNEKYAPIRVGQGNRKPPLTEEQRTKAAKTLKAHNAEAVKKWMANRVGKRGPNARLSEATVKQIFYSPETLLKTAEQFGVSKKMVLLIKQRKAHVYLTKDL